MDGILKVEPQQLISAAGEFNSTASNVGNLTNEMVSIVNALNSTWQSDSATAYISKANALESDISKLIGMIQEHSKDLEEIARNVENAEKTIGSEVGNLQTSVIN